MSRANKLWLVVTCILAHSYWPTMAFAESPLVHELRIEIKELKQSIKQLSDVVHNQNKRLDKLEDQPSKKIVESQGPAPTKIKQSETNIQIPQTAQTDEFRQLGFWKVPVKSSGPSRFIPNISVNGVFAAAYFSDDPGQIGHDPGRTGFNLQEIEVAIQSVIDPYVRADVFLGFSEDGVELEEAYITTLSLPKGLQVKAGLYLLPFGRQNQKHLESWAFVDENLVNQRLLGDEQFRELGVQISYLFPTPFFFLAQANFTQGTTPGNFDGNRKQDFAYTGRLSGSTELNDTTTLLMGASYAYGNNNTENGNATSLYGGDLLLKWRPTASVGIDWQTEYIYRHQQLPFGSKAEGGLYSYLLGNWTKRWGAGFRVDYMGIPKGTERTLRLSPMLVFRTTEFFQVKAQYEFINDSVLGNHHTAFLQWIFTMGPHAPHPF